MLATKVMSRFGGQDPNMLMGMLGGPPEDGRRVRLPELATLRKSVEQHPALQWDTRLNALAGQEGVVTKDDPSDGTSSVRFAPPISVLAWLPTKVLAPVEERRRPERPLPRIQRVGANFVRGGSPTNASPKAQPERRK